jgi:hypothetical protein
MRRINQVSIITVIALCVLGTVRVAAGDSDNQAKSKPSAVIQLIERAHDLTFQDNGTPGPSLGDRLIFTSDLFFVDGQPAGRDGADCVIVRIDPSAPPAEQQVVQCVVTVQLSDGEITSQGLAQGTENTFAITGGTGAYRTARGEALVKDVVPLQEANITITLFR